MNATDRRNDETKIKACFDALVAAAVGGERCPMNGARHIYSDLFDVLARRGWIKVEISGRNYRAVTIMTGPHAGKATAANPHGHPVWKVADKRGYRKTGVCQ